MSMTQTQQKREPFAKDFTDFNSEGSDESDKQTCTIQNSSIRFKMHQKNPNERNQQDQLQLEPYSSVQLQNNDVSDKALLDQMND